MKWLGLDIGGANLKVADGRGWARIEPFELWRRPAELATVLKKILRDTPHADGLAITMTGELCDCFPTKADGVRGILSAVKDAAAKRELKVYLVDGRLVSLAEARDQPVLAAASNWHALAQFVCRFVPGEAGVLVDIGSTTTDIIPLVDGHPLPNGSSDTERLVAGELVYTGVGRTPVCAMTDWLPWRATHCPVAAEFFATAADAYVVLGQLPEQYTFTDTADGRPLTKPMSQARLARMICADTSTFSQSDAEIAAGHIRDDQQAKLLCALEKVLANMKRQPETCLLSGTGEFLATPLAKKLFGVAAIISLADRLGPAVSAVGPAHALAVLASEFYPASGNAVQRGKY